MSAGIKTPQWKIDAMREMWRLGDTARCIATQLEVDRKTVARYCSDIERPYKAPMTNVERRNWLQEWQPCC